MYTPGHGRGEDANRVTQYQWPPRAYRPSLKLHAGAVLEEVRHASWWDKNDHWDTLHLGFLTAKKRSLP